MKVKDSITTVIIAAAAGMLQPFVPDLTPTRLIAALKEYDGDDDGVVVARHRPQSPYTIAEACRLLQVSKPTLYRMAKDGDLRMVKVRRATRIPHEEIERLLK